MIAWISCVVVALMCGWHLRKPEHWPARLHRSECGCENCNDWSGDMR